MLHNKYIMIGLLCLSSALLHGADEGEKLQPAEGRKLNFADCFDQKTALVAGPEKFYAPILVAGTSEVGLLHRFKSGIPFFASKLMRGIIAFVEGDDPILIQEVAKKIAEEIQRATLPDNQAYLLKLLSNKERSQRNTILEHALKSVLQEKGNSFYKLKDTKLAVHRVAMQSDDKELKPELIHYDCAEDEDGYALLQWMKIIDFRNDIFSPKIEEYHKFKKLCSPNGSVDDHLSALSKAAKATSTSHLAPFLVLNQERYKAFLAQEFEDQ